MKSGIVRLFVVALLISVLQVRAQNAALVATTDTPDRSLLKSLRIRGVITAGEMRAIDAAVGLNPAILTGAYSKASASSDPRGFAINATDTKLQLFGKDLLNRAKIEAIAAGTLQLQPDLQSKLQPLLSHTGDTDFSLVKLPGYIDVEALRSLENRTLIIFPLCPTGSAHRKADGTTDCIEGDPWSVELFRSVVPVLVDGKQTCTGSGLGNGLILTAAHCVLEAGAQGSVIISPSRIAIGGGRGGQFPVIGFPRVPQQMMLSCLPQCPNLDYDFALLQIDGASENVEPLPVLAAIPDNNRDILITLAGYGVTTINVGLSKSGLYIGSQHLKIVSKDSPIHWNYGFASITGSSFCSGDSGGPIFEGSPRERGDKLIIIGLISRFVSSAGTCFRAEASAVNFTSPGPRAVLCKMISNVAGLCDN